MFLLLQARSAVRDLDPLNDITFLRMRSKKSEILLAPGEKQHGTVCPQTLDTTFFLLFRSFPADKDFSLVVIQSPTEPDHGAEKIK